MTEDDKCRCTVASTGKKCSKNVKKGSKYCGTHTDCKKVFSPKPASPKKPSPQKTRLLIGFDIENDAYFTIFEGGKKVKKDYNISEEEFQPFFNNARKIPLQDNWLLLLDKEGEPFYYKKITKETTRKAPFQMSKVFPNGFEVIKESPYYKGKIVEVSIESESESESDSDSGFDQKHEHENEYEKLNKLFPGNKGSLEYLKALNRNIQCDSQQPCDDGECDLEYSKCVPKTKEEYYDDIERFEHEGASFVGKKSTIEKMKLAIKEKEKEKEKAKKEAEDKVKKDAKAKKDAEDKAKKEAKPKKEEDVGDDLDLSAKEEGELTELQQALIKCLMPSAK